MFNIRSAAFVVGVASTISLIISQRHLHDLRNVSFFVAGVIAFAVGLLVNLVLARTQKMKAASVPVGILIAIVVFFVTRQIWVKQVYYNSYTIVATMFYIPIILLLSALTVLFLVPSKVIQVNDRVENEGDFPKPPGAAPSIDHTDRTVE